GFARLDARMRTVPRAPALRSRVSLPSSRTSMLGAGCDAPAGVGLVLADSRGAPPEVELLVAPPPEVEPGVGLVVVGVGGLAVAFVWFVADCTPMGAGASMRKLPAVAVDS